MDPHRLSQLVALLTELREQGSVAPHLPPEVWRALAGLVPQLALELVVTRTGRDALLVDRHDEDWQGWHVPGGFFACGESVGEAADRIARRELGVGVTLREVLGAYAWPDHPYAHALSLLCVCEADATPAEGTFFTSAPEPMVPHHAAFLRAFYTRPVTVVPQPELRA